VQRNGAALARPRSIFGSTVSFDERHESSAARSKVRQWKTSCSFELAGHCDGKVFDETLAETLLWAWRGYPLD